MKDEKQDYLLEHPLRHERYSVTLTVPSAIAQAIAPFAELFG